MRLIQGRYSQECCLEKGEPARQTDTGKGDRHTLGMSCLRTVPCFSGTESQKYVRSSREGTPGLGDSWSLREKGSEFVFLCGESWGLGDLPL